MAIKRFSFCFIIFVAVLGSIECEDRDRIFSNLLDKFEKDGVSEEVVKLLENEVTYLTKQEDTELKTIQKQRELTSSLFIICLYISKQCKQGHIYYENVKNAFQILRDIGKQLDYDLKIRPVHKSNEFLLNIDSFIKAQNTDPKKTHDELISLFGQGIQLADSFKNQEKTDTEKLEKFYEFIIEISHQFARIESEIGYKFVLSLENAFNVFLDIFDRKKLEGDRKKFKAEMDKLGDLRAFRRDLGHAYRWAVIHVQRLGPSKRNEHITYLKRNYTHFMTICESTRDALKQIESVRELIEKCEKWQFESCAPRISLWIEHMLVDE